MEVNNTTPVAQEPAQPESTVVPESTVQPGPEPDGVQNPPSAPQGEPEAHRQNWNNGRRRIEQRQSLKARVRELEAKLAEYRGRDDDESKFRAEMVSDRLDDMRAMAADADANEFASRAEQWFGDETDQFMQQTYKYAPYVNQNEPDLLRYAQREYGPILLHEWYKRMDNPALRQQWLQMTAYEKGAVLANFYNKIAEVVNQKPTDVPVPAGGRQTPSSEPTDDFGIELGRAFDRHKG